MKHRSVACHRSLTAVLVAAFAWGCQDASPTVTVYKTPTCGCCTKWVEHLEAASFEVSSIELPDLDRIKREQRVPAELASCHTAVIDGYVIEGHVPASDVRRLLEAKPAVRGLAVPGMPIGSPGMEGPDPERYTVYAFDEQGRASPFATHGP